MSEQSKNIADDLQSRFDALARENAQLKAQNEVLGRLGVEVLSAQAKLKALLHNATQGIIQFNSKGLAVSLNRAAEDIFKVREKDFLNQKLDKLIPCPPNYHGNVPMYLVDYCSTHEDTFTHPLTGIDNLGKSFPIQVSISEVLIKDLQLHSPTGADFNTIDESFQSTFVMVNDITQAKLIEVALTEAKEEAEALARSKSEFLANMSHEMRTPMHAILSFSDMGLTAVEKEPNERLERYMTRIRDSGHRLLALLNDLLDLAKLEAGKMVFQVEEGDLAYVTQVVVQELSGLAAKKNLEIVTKPHEHNCRAEFDSAKIQQVVRNLLSNAIKFTEENSTITVSYHKTQLPSGRRSSDAGQLVDAVVVTVEDEGIGIPESELDSVFDKFTQSSRTNTGAGGTGLGLAICKDIIRAHHGRIWAESRGEHKGARFSVALPVINLMPSEG